jgi:peptidylprolyl isomerase
MNQEKPTPITSGEWWTLGIGLAFIIIMLAVLFFTGSPVAQNDLSGTSANPFNFSTTTASSPTTAVNTPSTQSQTPAVAQPGDTVTVNYTGKLADGTVFDSSASHGQPFSFVLGAGQVIPGWDTGIVGMTVGQQKTLVIPPAQAYGAKGVQDPSTGKYIIPPNATLTFDVQLVSIQPPTSTTAQ